MASTRTASRAPAAAERILAAADRLFTHRGYGAVSVRDIAEEAGVPKAVVFYHFQTKGELFERVIERYYSAHRTAMQTASSKEGPLKERIHAVLDAYLDFIEENRRFPLLVGRELSSDEEVPASIVAGLDLMAEWFAETFSGLFPADGPLGVRHFFVSFAGIVLYYHLYAPTLWRDAPTDPMSVAGLRERREHVHWLVEQLLAGLEPPQGG